MANSRKSISPNSQQGKSLLATFERALEEILARVVISAGDAIAVAYSGGLDSSVLLRLASDVCRQRSIPLLAFHVHHGLSPNAEAWLIHARDRCEQLGVAFDAQRVSVTGMSEQGIEEAARRARYAALGAMCARHKVSLLLSAHHEDDQAETVMLQWLRGAGLPGLSGMASVQQAHPLLPASVALGRPLLEIPRAQLEEFASHAQIDFVSDESNADSRYRRNAIRNEIFPVIARHVGGYAHTLVRSARHAQHAQRLLDELARSDLSVCGAGDALDLDALGSLSEDRKHNLIRHWVHGITARYPSEAQLVQLQQQMLGASADAHPRLQLGDWVIERSGRMMLIRPLSVREQPPADALKLVWRGEPEISVPSWQGKLVFETGPGLDRDLLLSGPLSLRARAGGERIKLHPSRPSRSLKNLFQESGLLASERPWLPLLYVEQQLVFAAGLGVDVRAGLHEAGVVLRWESVSRG